MLGSFIEITIIFAKELFGIKMILKFLNKNKGFVAFWLLSIIVVIFLCYFAWYIKTFYVNQDRYPVVISRKDDNCPPCLPCNAITNTFNNYSSCDLHCEMQEFDK
jgi:hypothetical protein